VLTLDTSGLIALVSPTDRNHQQAVAVVEADKGPFFIPMGIMAEIAYILEQRAGMFLLLYFLQDLRSGAYEVDCGDGDLDRIEALVRRYADLRLGYADSAVVACAERHGGRVLTTDRRHFPVVARGEGTIHPLPV